MLNRTINRCALVLAGLVVASSGRTQADVSSNVVGVVLGEDGSAVKGAAVTIRCPLHAGLTRSGFTDSKGKFRFREVVPGDYTVTIESPTYTAFQQEHVQSELGATIALKVKLSATGGNAAFGQAPLRPADYIGDLTAYAPAAPSRPMPYIVAVPPKDPDHRPGELREPIEIVRRPTAMLGGPPHYAQDKK